jgi:hypothetical protein
MSHGACRTGRPANGSAPAPADEQARLGKAKHETTLGHVEEVEVFEQVARNFQAAGCARDLSLMPLMRSVRGQVCPPSQPAALSRTR